VHPDVVLFADVGDGDERVEGSVHGGSRRGADEEGNEALPTGSGIARESSRQQCQRVSAEK